MKKISLFRLVFVMLFVACGAAALLAWVYQVTKGPIQQAQNAKELQAIADVTEGEFDNDPFEEKAYISTPDNKQQLILYPARKDGNINAVAIKTTSNKGFGGQLDLIVGFFLDGSISGFKVINSNETPGLGSKVNEKRFQEQFFGVIPQKDVFKVRQDGGEIDAVTGATISSRAVIEAIQNAYDAYQNFSIGIK